MICSVFALCGVVIAEDLFLSFKAAGGVCVAECHAKAALCRP